MKALDDITILDFSRVLAGPYATVLLADLGARVIKVEPPSGDDYRHIGPFVKDSSALFAFANRGKESIALDLKSPQDLEIALSLAEKADVVVENFRPGVAGKLGIGADALMQRNPRLVYASISGYGQTGAQSNRPAYDIIIQAVSGLMSVTGDPEGPPTMVGEAIGDLTAGLFASWAILAALHQRQKTDQGSRVDLAMFDALLAMMPTAACRYLATGEVPERVGNRHPLSAPFGAFRTRDGHVVVAVLNSKLFEGFANVIGRPDFLSFPRFANDESRTRNEGELRTAFETWAADKDDETVVALLAEAGIPVAPISTVDEAIALERSTGRHQFRLAKFEGQELTVPEQPAIFTGAERGRITHVPQLDEHGSAIRAWATDGA